MKTSRIGSVAVAASSLLAGSWLGAPFLEERPEERMSARAASLADRPAAIRVQAPRVQVIELGEGLSFRALARPTLNPPPSVSPAAIRVQAPRVQVIELGEGLSFRVLARPTLNPPPSVSPAVPHSLDRVAERGETRSAAHGPSR